MITIFQRSETPRAAQVLCSSFRMGGSGWEESQSTCFTFTWSSRMYLKTQHISWHINFWSLKPKKNKSRCTILIEIIWWFHPLRKRPPVQFCHQKTGIPPHRASYRLHYHRYSPEISFNKEQASHHEATTSQMYSISLWKKTKAFIDLELYFDQLKNGWKKLIPQVFPPSEKPSKRWSASAFLLARRVRGTCSQGFSSPEETNC